MKKDIQTGVNDPLVNITEFEDKTTDEGYGTTVEKPISNTGTVSAAMIKRFNQHSIMVTVIIKNFFSQIALECKLILSYSGLQIIGTCTKLIISFLYWILFN